MKANKNANRAREVAALLMMQPRGFKQGAMLAGAKPFNAGDRQNFIAAKNRLRAELDSLADTRSA
jgi:hypothetical protein